METPEQNDLEKFIHAQLRKLPDREAPEALVNNVLAAIARKKKQPWWQQSFTFWPKRVQCLLFGLLGSMFAAVVYGASHAAQNVPVPDVSGHFSAYGWVLSAGRTLAEAAYIALASLPLQWFFAIALVFTLLYGACLAAGFALFKVTARAGASA